jgi:hypothetical protein
MAERPVAITVEADTGRRLKTYASAMGTSAQQLATEILEGWLDKQPLVGGPRNKKQVSLCN